MTKRTTGSWFLSRLPSRKTRSKTINTAYIKKVLSKSIAIFKPKRPGLQFQDWFLSWLTHQVNSNLSLRVPGEKRHGDDPHPPYSLDITPVNFFFLSKSEVRADQPLCCPRTALRQARQGSQRISPKISSPLPPGSCMNAATSEFRSAMTTLRKKKVEK